MKFWLLVEMINSYAIFSIFSMKCMTYKFLQVVVLCVCVRVCGFLVVGASCVLVGCG